ncbi:MAG: HPP family protein [Chloroflexi bacterium]|nr:HPP family protein [Chloroflexota bacterium]
MAALSLGLSILFMAVTNTEHPPAAGTALGLIIHGFDWNLVLFVLLSALLMSLIRMVLRPRLTNLL